MIELLKKNYFVIGALIIFVGVLISILWGEVEFVPKQILTLDSNHQTVTKDYVFPKIVYPIMNFVSSAVIPFGITLIITMFFVNNFTKQENKQLQEQLLAFQNNTAENAIYSIFKTIIEPSFFEIVKEDVLNCKMIRKDAKWIYDIEEKDGKMKMTRTISYTVKNLSTKNQSEIVKASGFSNSYVKTQVVELKYKKQGDSNGFQTIYSINDENPEESSASVEKNIEVEGANSVEIIKKITQIFESKFVYETHFANEPLTDLEIEVNFPENYIFSLNNSFLGQFIDQPIVESKRIVYKFKKAILKGQGIEFFCEKNNPR